jgi:hypothetical protein
MALENLNWGYTKIRDALRTGLKIEIGRTGIERFDPLPLSTQGISGVSHPDAGHAGP